MPAKHQRCKQRPLLADTHSLVIVASGVRGALLPMVACLCFYVLASASAAKLHVLHSTGAPAARVGRHAGRSKCWGSCAAWWPQTPWPGCGYNSGATFIWCGDRRGDNSNTQIVSVNPNQCATAPPPSTSTAAATDTRPGHAPHSSPWRAGVLALRTCPACRTGHTMQIWGQSLGMAVIACITHYSWQTQLKRTAATAAAHSQRQQALRFAQQVQPQRHVPEVAELTCASTCRLRLPPTPLLHCPRCRTSHTPWGTPTCAKE